MNLLFPLFLIGTGVYLATRTTKAQAATKLPPEVPTEPDLPRPPVQYTWQEVLHPSEGCMMQTGRTYRYQNAGPHFTKMEELAELPLGTVFPSNWVLSNWQHYEFKWQGDTGYYEWPHAMFEHGEKLEVRVP